MLLVLTPRAGHADFVLLRCGTIAFRFASAFWKSCRLVHVYIYEVRFALLLQGIRAACHGRDRPYIRVRGQVVGQRHRAPPCVRSGAGRTLHQVRCRPSLRCQLFTQHDTIPLSCCEATLSAAPSWQTRWALPLAAGHIGLRRAMLWASAPVPRVPSSSSPTPLK